MLFYENISNWLLIDILIHRKRISKANNFNFFTKNNYKNKIILDDILNYVNCGFRLREKGVMTHVSIDAAHDSWPVFLVYHRNEN